MKPMKPTRKTREKQNKHSPKIKGPKTRTQNATRKENMSNMTANTPQQGSSTPNMTRQTEIAVIEKALQHGIGGGNKMTRSTTR